MTLSQAIYDFSLDDKIFGDMILKKSRYLVKNLIVIDFIFLYILKRDIIPLKRCARIISSVTLKVNFHLRFEVVALQCSIRCFMNQILEVALCSAIECQRT